MTTALYEKYAVLLLDYSLSIQPGQTVLVRSTPLATPLLQVLYRELLKRGAVTEFELTFENQNRLFYDNVTSSGNNHIGMLYNHAVHSFDAIINVIAPYNLQELKGVNPDKKLARQHVLAPIKKMFMKRSAEKSLNWVLCVFPTEASANECGMSLEEYENFVFNACHLYEFNPIQSWKQHSAFQQQIVDFLNTKSQFHFKGPGTDITFSTQNRIWINSDGKRNMPSGEVFTSPVEESVNGTVYFSFPTLYEGEDVQGVTLSVEDGVIQKWHAEQGQPALDQAFSIPGSRAFGEVAIGTNKHIQQITKNILFDEKIGGSIHMAVGASYPETGGKNESSLHWDLITDMKSDGSIYADQELIYENGTFLI